MDTAVLGATDRAFFYLDDSGARAAARAALVADLGRLFTVHEATDWDDWRVKVRTHPKLLMLLVHTDEVMGARVLEIGHEDLLTAAEIRADVSGEPDEGAHMGGTTGFLRGGPCRCACVAR